MRRTTAALAVSLMAATASVGQPGSTVAQTQGAAPPEGSIVTVTGCVRAGDQSDVFVLTNIRWEPNKAPKQDVAGHHDSNPQRNRPATPKTSATGQTDTPAPRDRLRLAGAAARLEVNEHLGHTVSVTGMLAPEDPVVTPPIVVPDEAAADKSSRSQSGPAAMQRKQVLNVRSITHVSDTCM